MATKGNIAQNNLFFIIKQLEIVKIFHEGKEENWSEQENFNKFYKIVQNYFTNLKLQVICFPET
jgi:hypothetical protein